MTYRKLQLLSPISKEVDRAKESKKKILKLTVFNYVTKKIPNQNKTLLLDHEHREQSRPRGKKPPCFPQVKSS